METVSTGPHPEEQTQPSEDVLTPFCSWFAFWNQLLQSPDCPLSAFTHPLRAAAPPILPSLCTQSRLNTRPGDRLGASFSPVSPHFSGFLALIFSQLCATRSLRRAGRTAPYTVGMGNRDNGGFTRLGPQQVAEGGQLRTSMC